VQNGDVEVPREREVSLAVPGTTLVLEGRYQPGRGRGAAVVAPPHPLMGGSLDSPVVNEIAFGLHLAGVASIRFNWRGVGQSTGRATDDPTAARADYRAALDWLAETESGPYIGAGYSFGAVTAWRLTEDEPRIERLILVAPPAAMLRDVALERACSKVHVLAAEHDELSNVAELGREVRRAGDIRIDVVMGENHFFSQGHLSEVSELVRLALLDDGRSIDLDLSSD
jgi:alpha/beta superfamily hydrolase